MAETQSTNGVTWHTTAFGTPYAEIRYNGSLHCIALSPNNTVQHSMSLLPDELTPELARLVADVLLMSADMLERKA